MFSDAGGAFARRRRDASITNSHICFTSRHLFPDHHRTLLLFSSMVVGDLLFMLDRDSGLHRSSNLLTVVDESYFPWVLARSIKSKSASKLETELNLSYAVRSMDSSCCASLVDHLAHQRSINLDSRRNFSSYGKKLAQKTLRFGLAGDKSCTTKRFVSVMKWNFFLPLSSISTPTVQKPMCGLNQIQPLPTSPDFRESLNLFQEALQGCCMSSATIFLSFSVTTTEESDISLRRRRALTAQSGLGQSLNKEGQRLCLIWAWPIILVIWGPFSLIKSMRLKPINICLIFYLAGPNILNSDKQLPKATLFARSHQLRSSSSQSSSELLVISIPLFQISSCRGQERTISPSSFSKERTFLPFSLSMRCVFLLISLGKMSYILIALLSSVMVYTGPVETTDSILMHTEIMDLVAKSLVKLTKLMSVENFGRKTIASWGVFVFDSFNIYPDHLSNFIKFESLSLNYACSNVLSVMVAFRACPIMPIYHVPFSI